MTACKSQGYTGLCFSSTTFVQKPSHHTMFSGGYTKQSWSIIFRYLVDVNTISSQMQVVSFAEGLIRPITGPVSVPFLSVTLICISPHIERKKNFSELLNALFGDWVSLIRMQIPSDMSGNPPLHSAQLQPTVKVFRLFRPRLNPFDRLKFHVHGTWTYHGVSITGPAASRFLFFS